MWSVLIKSPISQIHINNTLLTPDTENHNHIPKLYHDLMEAFSTTQVSKLPQHRLYDCSINLLSDTSPPESKAMEAYIQEELNKGFIQSSTSPASAGFFFVEKKDGGLRPCIDDRGLNNITVKFHYPLSLVPSALEQLRNAKYFTKLNLRNAYNLIRIKEGDEWKTAFSTSSGHYDILWYT